MKLEEHEKQSIEWFGKPWTKVHLFLDQYFPMFRGADHRRILHTVEGVREVVRRFGVEASPVAELHIKEDWVRYCGLFIVPTRKEIDLDDWLFMNQQTIKIQNEIILDLFKEKV